MKFENTKSRGYGNAMRHVFYKTLLIGFLAAFSFSLHAQDTDNQEFWFVAPDASNAHDDRPTFFMITTGDKPATVTISMPANPTFKTIFPSHTDTVRTIPANSYWKFTFSTTAQMNLIENAYTSSGTPTNKGVLITSTTPVSAYYQIDGSKNNQKEIFTLKGKKALGKEFYMPFQTKYGISATFNVDAFRQIQIVATENNTTVTINPKGELAIGTTSSYVPAGTQTTRVLQKGETLLWRGRYRTTTGLTGSRITSDKPIAITWFEDGLQGTAGSIDPIGDQLVPTNNLGKHYIVMKGYSNGVNEVTDNVVFVAAENNTTVYINGQQRTLTNAGDFWSYDLGPGNSGTQAYYVNATKPVYCVHQSAVDTEMGGALLPSLYSISGRRITFMKGTLPVNAMFLVFRESAKNGFTLDGNPLTVNAQPAGFDDWRYAKVTLTNTAQVCTVANREGSFSLGYFNGSSTGTALYGYLSAFGTFSFESDTIYHCGDSYQFDAPYALSYKWTLPDNSTLTGTNRLRAIKSGRYSLEVNQDPYVITDETYLKLQNFNHLLSTPEQLLPNKPYNFTIELNPQKDPDNYFNAKYRWTFGEGASVQTSDDPAAKVSYSTPGTKTISLQIWNENALCDTTITRTITVRNAADGEVVYWRTDAENHDWNNVNNWANAAGEPMPVVPSTDSKVYLPGNAAKYPSLTEKNTDRTHYGQPEVKGIVFRHGSELHYQHKLKYEKAYINYNWGYYANNGTNPNGQPKNSWENAKELRRDAWHILAAPLKSMASGDFSLAGHPFSWQKRFKVAANPQGSVAEGDFSLAFPANDIALSTTNNAIAVKMAGQKDEAGYRQENLEGLKGMIEIPYFEDKIMAPYYPVHNYDALSKKSYFYYFDTKTLKILNSPLGSMNRAGEAYRFVYETDQNELPADTIYRMQLNREGIGSTREVMIGNPFLAPVNAEAFANANSDKIDVAQGYKLLSEDGMTWEQKFFTMGNAIPAWEAFIITLSEPFTSELLFPIGDITVDPLPATRASHDAEPADNALYMQIRKGGIKPGDHAMLQNNSNTNDTEIRKMILPEGHETPETFFLSSNRDLSYLIRNLAQGEKEIPIGVKTSDVHSRLSLEFRNVSAFTASTGASMILVDKYLNVRQDLTRNPAYIFTQHTSGLDRQYVDKNRFVLQLGGETGTIEQDDPESGLNVMYQSGILKVTSDENIDAVWVYNLYGQLVFSAHSINLSQYTQPVSLRGKLFLVRVRTSSGAVKAKKIMDH